MDDPDEDEDMIDLDGNVEDLDDESEGDQELEANIVNDDSEDEI